MRAQRAFFWGVLSYHNGKLGHTIFGGLHIRSSPNFVCPISSPSQFPPRGNVAFCGCGASNKTCAGGFAEQEQRKNGLPRKKCRARCAPHFFGKTILYNFRIQKMGVFIYGFPHFLSFLPYDEGLFAVFHSLLIGIAAIAYEAEHIFVGNFVSLCVLHKI